jgi:7-cyano-7-deazaguanine synthase in queuosine biosynthesis
VRHASGGARQNFLFNVADAVAGLRRQLDAVELDWLDLLAALYAADLACDRGAGDTEWGRRITLCVAVREPDHWQALLGDLEGLFADLTYDTMRVVLSVASSPEPAPRQRQDPFPEVDCVALVSGGVDSLVGALELLDQGRQPLIVTHGSSGVTGGAQNAVTALLQSRQQDLEAVRFTARRASEMYFPGSENSQRSRTLLYMGVGALLARVLEVDELFVNENGVMAVHVPMTEARIGSLSTRTATPGVLERMAELANRAFGGQLGVENLLVGMTKPEVVERGLALGADAVMPETVSCWKMSRQSQHCGYCAPCMIRRISCLLHGAADADYQLDVFGDASTHDANEQVRDNLTHLIQFIVALDELDDAEILDEFPEIMSGGRAGSTTQSVALHKRWAAQARGLLASQPATGALVQ